MSNHSNPKESSDHKLQSEFMAITEDISNKLKTEGIHVRPYLPGLPHFCRTPLEKQKLIIEQVRFYQEICSSQINEGYRIRDNRSLTWRAFRRLGLIPTSDFLSHITDEDIVEIYSTSHIQLFRNFTFFDLCSYTLEELMTQEWWRLFDRDPNIIEMIIQEATKILTGQITETYTPRIPEHVINEINSAEKNRTRCEIRKMAPLFKDRKIAACIVIEKIKLLPS